MTARLFFDIGAQPYERRREQPSRDLGSRINFYIVQGASKVEFNHHMLGSGSSTYRSTLLLDADSLNILGQIFMSSVYRKAEVPADRIFARSHQSQRT